MVDLLQALVGIVMAGWCVTGILSAYRRGSDFVVWFGATCMFLNLFGAFLCIMHFVALHPVKPL